MWNRFPKTQSVCVRSQVTERYVWCYVTCCPGPGTGRAVHTLVCDHDVVVVTVPDPQDVRGHAVTSTGLHKALHRLKVLRQTTCTHFKDTLGEYEI